MKKTTIKTAAILLSFILAASAAACSDTSSATSDSSSVTVTSETSGSETSDNAARGMPDGTPPAAPDGNGGPGGNGGPSGTVVSTEVGTVSVTLDGTSTWTLTADSYITSFTGDAANVISNGYTLYVNGTALSGVN